MQLAVVFMINVVYHYRVAHSNFKFIFALRVFGVFILSATCILCECERMLIFNFAFARLASKICVKPETE